jgi:hypothetical protein
MLILDYCLWGFPCDSQSKICYRISAEVIIIMKMTSKKPEDRKKLEYSKIHWTLLMCSVPLRFPHIKTMLTSITMVLITRSPAPSLSESNEQS